MSIEALRKNDMMAYLLDCLNEGQTIGHYGRLVFTMVARFFLDEAEVVGWLAKDPGFSEEHARALYFQVRQHDYSPPHRDRVLLWQERQTFPICPNPYDPDSCNVYKDLQFPEHVYEHISEYYDEKAAPS